MKKLILIRVNKRLAYILAKWPQSQTLATGACYSGVPNSRFMTFLGRFSLFFGVFMGNFHENPTATRLLGPPRLFGTPEYPRVPQLNPIIWPPDI